MASESGLIDDACKRYPDYNHEPRSTSAAVADVMAELRASGRWSLPDFTWYAVRGLLESALDGALT